MNSTAICEPGGTGLLLPFSQAEHEMNKAARAVIYILLLLYMFMGVGTVADCFMNAVDKIISKKRRIYREQKQRTVTYLVWNNTVADLTLLALGSSAPEILLSVLEIMSNGFYSGELGPSTIVGSAAFNLLIILAVCILAIPNGEIRAIEHMSVYHVTVIFSIFAYMWLLFIVEVITPNVIDIWEGFITFVMFPILVVISWLANKGKLQFLALEKKSNEDDPVSDMGSRRASIMDEESNAAQKSQHPRLKLRGSVAAAIATTGTRKSHVNAEVQQASGEDKAIPAGSNGKDIQDPISKKRIHAPHGIITFRSDAVEVEDHQFQDEPTVVKLDILRCNGSEGTVSCKLQTEGLSAVPGRDFEEMDETIEFADGETFKEVDLCIFPQRPLEPDDVLQLVLTEVEGDAFFNPNDDGGKAIGLLTITIKNSDSPSLMERLFDKDNFFAGLEAWKQQIIGSVKLEEEEPEDGEDPAPLKPKDYILFVLGLPFNIFFSIVCPPAMWAGGFLLFVVALSLVAVVTALISDLASLFGCCAGIPDATTAITIVAMGTSLPDTFASMTSASKDDTADSSIVNVTGSNSVNVYLGIGIPWLAAAIYWASASGDTLAAWKERYADVLDGALIKNYPNGAFVVQGGALGFSVLIFNCVAITCLVILRVRRLALGGELGGPKKVAYGSSSMLIFLWFCYTGSSIWRNSSTDAEVMVFPLAAIAVIAVIGGLVFEISGKFRYDAAAAQEDAEARKGLKDYDTPQVVVHGVAEDMNVDVNDKIKNDNIKEGLEPEKIGASTLEIPEVQQEGISPNAQEAPEVDAEVMAESSDRQPEAENEVTSPDTVSVEEGKKKRPSPKKSARATEASDVKEKKVPKKKSEKPPKADADQQ